jgi:hypothetical protein
MLIVELSHAGDLLGDTQNFLCSSTGDRGQDTITSIQAKNASRILLRQDVYFAERRLFGSEKYMNKLESIKIAKCE